MTEFTTQKGKVIHVVHQAVTVACSWASDTPRKPRYTFSWETGSIPARGASTPATTKNAPTLLPSADEWSPGSDSRNQPDVDDSGILELEDYPDEEADRLWREEYEEQLKPD